MINGYQAKLMDMYAKLRENEAANLKKRKAEIQKLYPAIIEIDNQIQKLSLQLSLAILKSTDSSETLKEYKNRITDLRMKKGEMLVARGYSADYLNIHYRCSKCNDTGFIGTQKCTCYKEGLIKLYYDNSSLRNILNEKNFNNFDINLFSPHRLGDEKYSPRRNIENIYEYIRGEYIPHFNNIDTNLLFFGSPGSGKSYLSYCIAKDLLDLGHLVVYKTADELISDLKSVRFNNNTKLNEALVECDLLIIDDLGTEQINEFTITELFNLLNTKLLKNKKMLISTNLTLADITKVYSERISSRLLGEFKLFKFYSEDIRIAQNLKRNKF
ncbi:MAG: ATP-binding protein [Clostridiaceae bacterium]|nr:ATP-binding protein [Clostridiaceae bacterium]